MASVKRTRFSRYNTMEGIFTPALTFQEHPLLNSLILLHVLGYNKPNVEELKRIRLVCKTWCEITLAWWRSTAVVKLVSEPPFFSIKSRVGIPTGVYFNEARNEQSPYRLMKTPFSRYKFENMTIDIAACDNEEDSKMFWDMIGPFAQYVHFEKCIFTDSLEYYDKPFVQLLVRKLPNANHVFLTDVQFDDENKMSKRRGYKRFLKCHLNLATLTARGGFNIDLESLFTLAPKLETICGRDGSLVNVGYYDLLDKVRSTVCYGREGKLRKGLTPLPNLKYVDLMGSRTFVNAWFLRGKLEGLAREKLNLKTFMATVGEGSIDKFIVSMAPKLEVLKLFRAPFSGPLSNFLHEDFEKGKVIKMAAMRELHLWGNVADTFQFLKFTPNLQVLYINLGCFEKQKEIKDIVSKYGKRGFKKLEDDMAGLCDWEWMNEVIVEKVEALHIDYEFPVMSLKMMAEWMPNLKSLKTILTKRTVAVVCKEWANLKELVCLFGSTIANSNFVCSDRDTRRHNATIGNLKELERFQLDSLCGKSNLSDDCVFTGLLKMTALKSVQICVGEMMSTNAEEMLKQRFGTHCRVIRNYTGGDHSNYDCCARAKFNLDCENDFQELREKVESSKGEDSEDAASLRSSSSSDSE